MTIDIKTLGGRVLYTVEAATDVRAYLQDAVLRGGALRGAVLRDAYLRGAALQDADLRGADLRGADLRGADLRGADLRGAALRGADLRGANLQGANLQDANLRDAKNAELAIAKTRILPDDGQIIGWKNAHSNDGKTAIVKLLIPTSAKRSHASGRKCRASKAKVLAITDKSGNKIAEARSEWDETFVYRVGETVAPREPFDENMWSECASGIHFYITRLEAENH
jgi:hypothetical protein